jgi:hypothetical protein
MRKCEINFLYCVVLYCTFFQEVSPTDKSREIDKTNISCENVRSLSHLAGGVPQLLLDSQVGS